MQPKCWVHWYNLVTSLVVNNAMSKCVSHLRGRGGSAKTYTYLPLKPPPNSVTGMYPSLYWYYLNTVNSTSQLPSCLAAWVTSIIYDREWNWLWLKDPHWKQMNSSIIAARINLCFQSSPWEQASNPRFKVIDISRWQSTGDSIIMIVKF